MSIYRKIAIHFSGKNGISIVTDLGQFIRVENVQVYCFCSFYFEMILLCNKGCLEVHDPLAPASQVPTLPCLHKTGFFCIVQAVLKLYSEIEFLFLSPVC